MVRRNWIKYPQIRASSVRPAWSATLEIFKKPADRVIVMAAGRGLDGLVANRCAELSEIPWDDHELADKFTGGLFYGRTLATT